MMGMGMGMGMEPSRALQTSLSLPGAGGMGMGGGFLEDDELPEDVIEALEQLFFGGPVEVGSGVLGSAAGAAGSLRGGAKGVVVHRWWSSFA